MKIFTNKDWKFIEEGMRLKYAKENAELQLRNAKLKYLETALGISVDDMDANAIEDWCINYRVNARMADYAKHFYQGAISGANALCDALKAHNLIYDELLESIRIGILNKIKEHYDEETERSNNP